MRLLAVPFVVLLVVTTGVSSNYTSITTLPDISNRNGNESLNIITIGSNNITPSTTDATIIDDDYNISYGIEATTHDTNNNNKSKRNKNINVVSDLEKQLNNTFKTLTRHQRAIATLAERKGLLRESSGEHILRRGKRYLQFAKGSRVSWRTTGKNNILNVNTLWGYGYGFRANFPFPGPEETRRPFFKRDVLHSLADILDGHGLDGRACILKSYCTAALDADSNISGGMLFKMLKLIFTLHENEKRHFPYLRLDNCKQILHSHCPLSFDSISPYTDDV